ncbi:hypothetical protein VPH35_091014 [Triticum aestivum]|uniref:F-box domain-containing protein n=2 Tax=Triticum TaxID=4564 RepID=A0A9R0XCE0_TRITD|nr:F-box/FBD/LRR-repeat protein At3g26920-like isoform X1 [Triticum aestivum]VAI34032.1 unnamed protein product [Triticum turgidum subsp. durum]
MLNRVMSMQRESRRLQIQPHNGPADSTVHRKDSTCTEDHCSQGGEPQCPGPHLPEDIWCHIFSLLPMQDAARTACVSHAFKRSWRCYPNLAFNAKALGMDERSCGEDEIVRNFTSRVDNILKNHSCIAIKTLEIVFRYYDDKVCNLDGWLQTAITPGIEELTVQLSTKSRKHYNFPWSLLANENGKLIQYLKLSCCAFSPTVGLCLKSLSRLELFDVNITRDQMGSLLHNFFALQRMQLKNCNNITCLKMPFHLQQLKYLEVLHCSSLKVIEIEAPNLSNFQFMGLCQVQLSLGVALQFKKFDMSFPGVVSYACTNLLSNLQYVEALSLCSRHEIIDTPVLPSKFLHLKHLSVDLNAMTFPPTYDYCSLISLFDASPSLETLVLNVLQRKMLHESIVGDTSNLRQIPGHRHDRLKTVKIIGFSSAKSVVELTCHIIENTASLQCLTLDTTTGHPWHSCLTNYSGKCLHLRVDFLVEVGKGLLAIKTYVEPKVPSRVKLNVVEPCRRCHDLEPLS